MGFKAGKTYEVTFANGLVLIVKLLGGEPLAFHVKGDGILEGTEWLNGSINIVEIGDN